MSTKTDLSTKTPALDWLKWLVVVVIVVGAIIANSYFKEYSILYRVLGIILAAVVAGVIAKTTTTGESVWLTLKASYAEIRKVVWPTKQETNQTTLIVLVLVVIASLILWGLDSLLGALFGLIIG